MGSVRIGVAGIGALGYHHARVLSGLEGVILSGVYDVRSERALGAAREFGTVAFEELEGLISASDGIVVAVPTLDHEAVSCAALERGVPVLVEKPLAPALDAADRILVAAERGGAFVQVGHVERFNPVLAAAREYLTEPLFVESHRLAPFTPRSTDIAVVLDLMIHDVDLVMHLVGSPVRELAASGAPVLTPMVDIANARLTFESGAVANLTASRVSTDRLRKIRIFQRSGYLSLDLSKGTGEFLRLREPHALRGSGEGGAPIARSLEEIVERIPLTSDAGEPLARELESFRDAVRRGGGPAVSGSEGRAALAVTLAIQERIESHVSDTH